MITHKRSVELLPSSEDTRDFVTLLYLDALRRGVIAPAATEASAEPPPHLTAGDDAILAQLDHILEESPGLMLPVGEGAEMKMRPLAELLTLDELLGDIEVESIAAAAIIAGAELPPAPSER